MLARCSNMGKANSSGDALSFNPSPNGSVYGLSLVGSTVYVAGGFASIGGQSRAKLSGKFPDELRRAGEHSDATTFLR